MSIDVWIAAASKAEFEALESEGAPRANMGSGTFVRAIDCFGIDTRPDVQEFYCGSLDPEAILAAAEKAEVFAFINGGNEHVLGADGPVNILLSRVQEIIEIATVAARIGKGISWG